MDIGKTRDLIAHKLSQTHTRFARGETVYRDEFTGVLDELRMVAESLPLQPPPAGFVPMPAAPVEVPPPPVVERPTPHAPAAMPPVLRERDPDGNIDSGDSPKPRPAGMAASPETHPGHVTAPKQGPGRPKKHR